MKKLKNFGLLLVIIAVLFFGVSSCSKDDELSPPSSISAVALSYDSIRVNWSSVSDATFYNIFYATSLNGTYSQIGTSTTLSYTHANLTNNSTYYYKIKSVNGTKESDFSATASATTPKLVINPPSSVNVETLSNSSIKITWNSVSNPTGYATYYYVYRGTSLNGNYIQRGNSTSLLYYTDTGLSQNTTYYYKVKSVVSPPYTVSDFSATASATTCTKMSSPTGLKATGERNAISLKWTKVTGATSYEIHRAASSYGTYSYLRSTSTDSYIDSGLSNGVTYYYKVESVNSCGESSSSSSYSYAYATTLK